MIEIPTTFVLGAGASAHAGFPCGTGLRKEICESCQYPNGDSLVALGFPFEHVSEFGKSFQKSSVYSVDEFLECRSEFGEIGKAAIAQCLIKYEDPDKLHPESDNWYRYLFHQMRARSLKEFSKNRVKFVTFNYDRSLEQFLFTAAMNLWGAEHEEVASTICNIAIYHVHGRLGYMPWQIQKGMSRWGSRRISALKNRRFRSYLPSPNDQNVRDAMQEIAIVHEDTHSDLLHKIRIAISESERVLFLGFSYHPTAMAKLGFPLSRTPDLLTGCCRGLSRREADDVCERYGIDTGEGNYDLDVLDFLKRHVSLSEPRLKAPGRAE